MNRSESVEENLVCLDDTLPEAGRVSYILELARAPLQGVSAEAPANDYTVDVVVEGSDPQCPTCRVVPVEVVGSDPQCPTCRDGIIGGGV
jgi:hypothetical protein